MSRPLRFATVMLASVSLAAAGFGGEAFSAGVKKFAARLQENPDFQRRIDSKTQGVSDPEKKRQIEIQTTSELSRRGVARLDNESLRGRLRLWGKIYAAADGGTCGALARGSASKEQVQEAMEKALSPADLDAWFDIQYKAVVAELKGQAPSQPEADPLKLALLSLFSSLGQGDGDRLEKIIANTGGLTKPSAVSEGELCWAMKTIATKVPAMKDDESLLLSRAFAM